MDVVTAYLYGSLDNDTYMKIPKGYRMPKAYNSKSLKDNKCLKHIN